MKTGGAKSQVELTAPPGFVSHTAFILKRMACTDTTPFSTQETSSLEGVLNFNSYIKQKALIVHDQLEHHGEESYPELSHEVPAQSNPEGACTGSLEEAPVFQPTDKELEDTLKYIESICQHGLSGIELNHDKRMMPLISDDKLLRAAHEAVKANWEVVVKQQKTPANLRWRDVCGKSSAFAKILKSTGCISFASTNVFDLSFLRVKSETQQRKYLCTGSKQRKMDKYFNKGAKKTCWHCNFNLYLSASFCPCNPSKYACLKHTKYLCSCGWTKRVFLYRLDISALNLLAEATEGSIDAVYRWVKQNFSSVLDDDREKPNVHVIPEDASSNGTLLLCNGEVSSSSIGGTNVKDAPKQLLSESMDRIWKASPVVASHFKYIESWKSTLYDSSDDSSSASDNEGSLPAKGKKLLPALEASHSTSNGKAVGSSKIVHEKQETNSSFKPETIICLSSDDED